MSFSSLKLHPDLVRGVARLGFDQPTPIQREAIPPALEGRDVLGCAMTGSGKTAAFLLPVLHRLLDEPRGTTRALVLAPTRELAAQIEEHLRDLAKYTRLKSAAIFGGVGMKPQEQAFRRGVDVIIATPGRLLDHLQHDYARLDGLEVLVLDEADRMLDMGFLPDIRRVLRHVPARRQTLFFSATMPRPIVELTKELLRDPVTLSIERESKPAASVAQAVYPVAEDLKPALLLELLRKDDIQQRDRLHADEAPREPVGGVPGKARRARRADPRQPLAGAADRGTRRLQEREVPRPRRDRHRAARHRRRGTRPCGQRRRAERPRGLYPPSRPDRPCRCDGRRLHLRLPRGGGRPARDRARDRPRLPRRKLEGFDYDATPEERFEIPLKERIAAIRARKAEERARAKAKAERKAQRLAEEEARGGGGTAGGGARGNGTRPSGAGGRRRRRSGR